MSTYSSFWKSVPMLRVLMPLILGIIIQWYAPFSVRALLVSLLLFTFFYFIVIFSSSGYPKWVSKFMLPFSIIILGALCVWVRDIRHLQNGLDDLPLPKGLTILTLADAPLEKANTWSATAHLNYLVEKDSLQPLNGSVQVYFRKDAFNNDIKLQTRLAIRKNFISIENSRNPGSFDYKRYMHFQGIDYQVFLGANDYIILGQNAGSRFSRFVNRIRERIIHTLQENIHSKKERGLAEALLIGYKQDLEQNLVQSYTNTGVAHIIAISGLHLGVIYIILMAALKPIGRLKKLQWLPPVLVIVFLWLFTLLAGAQPSIVRSAVMFSCLGIAEIFSRRSNIINSLAFSAGVMLFYNPYWLWDVGFQLSYAAVLSIVIFMRPIYSLLYVKNRVIDFIWKVCAVTLAAQILTLPLTLYYFHQFPLHFIVTNIVAVPFSNVVLITLMLLSSLFFWPAGAQVIGWLAEKFIWVLNTFIEYVEKQSYLMLDGISITKVQVICMYMFITGISLWLLQKNKQLILPALCSLLLFVSIRAYSFITTGKQKQMVVYNISGLQAIDFMNGYSYTFIGDSSLMSEGFKRNFHLKPSRILNRLQYNEPVYGLKGKMPYLNFFGKKIIVLDGYMEYAEDNPKPVVDVLLVTGNHNYTLQYVLRALQVKQVVLDGSVPQWKWPVFKKECDSLHIDCFYVKEQGPFVMNLP